MAFRRLVLAAIDNLRDFRSRDILRKLVAGLGDTAFSNDYNDLINTPAIPTPFTTEEAQDAVGAMVDTSLVYMDATPLLTRAALTGDVTATQGSNVTVLANTSVTPGSYTNLNATIDSKGRVTLASNGSSGGSGISIGLALALPNTGVWA